MLHSWVSSSFLQHFCISSPPPPSLIINGHNMINCRYGLRVPAGKKKFRWECRRRTVRLANETRLGKYIRGKSSAWQHVCDAHIIKYLKPPLGASGEVWASFLSRLTSPSSSSWRHVRIDQSPPPPASLFLLNPSFYFRWMLLKYQLLQETVMFQIKST